MSRTGSVAAETWSGRLVLVFLVVFTLMPFAGILDAALQPSGSNPSGLSVPRPPHLENFTTAFDTAHLPRLMGSSLLLLVMVVPAALVLAVTAAYGITVLRVPGAGVAFAVLLMGMALPIEGLITPLYFLMRDAGMLNTRLAIALPLIGLYTPFGVFWMRAHFLGVPRSLTEAASIDGAGLWTMFRHVHLPLAGPALLTLAVPYSLWTWNQFILALVMMDDPLRRTVGGALGAFQGQHGSNVVLLSAGTLLIMLPTIVAVAAVQRRIVAALLGGAAR